MLCLEHKIKINFWKSLKKLAMNSDFYYALTIGWSILLVFWFISVIFIFLRKTPKTKLTKRLNFQVIFVFLIGYFLINLFT